MSPLGWHPFVYEAVFCSPFDPPVLRPSGVPVASAFEEDRQAGKDKYYDCGHGRYLYVDDAFGQ